jgi:hypothetical protein
MRINLVTPFAEKDAVKTLGARWDANRKLWYILDVADITPFLRWIPKTEVATKNSATVSQPLGVWAAEGKIRMRKSMGFVEIRA